MKFSVFISILLLINSLSPHKDQNEKEKKAIKSVIIEAYVKGIHINRDVNLVKKGFHPEFTMYVLHEGQLIKASLDMWLERLQLDGEKNEDKIDYQFNLVDVSGYSAMVKMEINENAKHIYTDYFSLYKFEEGWKIVGKIFTSHD